MLALGFPHAILLGILGGILEFVPVAGWMITAVTILTVGSLAHAHWIWMAVLLGLWRVAMDYVIAPRVMGDNLEIHPLIVIFAMMVGGVRGRDCWGLPVHTVSGGGEGDLAKIRPFGDERAGGARAFGGD